MGPRSPCPNHPLLRHLGGSALLLQGWQGAEGTQAPPFWGATGTGRTRHSKASRRLAPGEPSGSAPPNKPGCKQSHRPSAFGVRPRVGLRTPKLCDTGEHSPEERGPTKRHRQPCPSWRGGPRRGCPREAPKRRPPGGVTTGVALTRVAWDKQGAAGSAVPQQGQRSPLRVTALQGHGVRARVPPGSPKRVPKPERTPAPSTSTQGTQPPPPPCRLCPHHPQPGGTPGDGPRPRAGLRSSPFFFFLLFSP